MRKVIIVYFFNYNLWFGDEYISLNGFILVCIILCEMVWLKLWDLRNGIGFGYDILGNVLRGFFWIMREF